MRTRSICALLRGPACVNLRHSPSADLTYAAIDGVLYVVDTVLPRARDQYQLVWVLVQPLFHARVITTLLGRLGVCMVLLLFVVVDAIHVPLRDILGRLLCGGRSLRGRSRGTVGDLIMSADSAGDYFRGCVEALRAAGEAKPGMSDVLESWRAKDPYGLLSSSSHIAGQYSMGLFGRLQ